MKKKITILSHNLSGNSFGRAYLLARVLMRRYDIEIVGTCFGNGVWPPCSNINGVTYKILEGCNYPKFFSSFNKLLKMITGDVIYAIKALPTSFGIGILKHISSRLPLVLDIDDWEVGFYLSKTKMKFIEKSLNFINPNGLPYCWLLEKMTGFADKITTVSPFLQNKFGGVIIPHGKDTETFDPKLYNSAEAKKKIAPDECKIIMYLGSPRHHKGLEDVIYALDILNRKDVIFVVIGSNPDKAYEKHLLTIGKERIRLFGMINFNDIPFYLSAADIVVIPQRALPETIGQVPAKLFDAMAMARPIISTRVSMIPQILDGGGCLFDPGDSNQLADLIEYLLSNPEKAQELGAIARERCIANYSWDRMEEDLAGIFDVL